MKTIGIKNPRKLAVLIIAISVLPVSLLISTGCSSNKTGVSTDTTVGSRIGQVAITRAMDNAFKQVDWASITGKKVTWEVTDFGQTKNNEFYKAYLGNMILANGGVPADANANSDTEAQSPAPRKKGAAAKKAPRRSENALKVSLLIKVGGIDEIGKNYILVGSQFVQSQFEAVVTITESGTGKLVRSQTIFGQAKVDRNGLPSDMGDKVENKLGLPRNL
jgi:hypothetical protein